MQKDYLNFRKNAVAKNGSKDRDRREGTENPSRGCGFQRIIPWRNVIGRTYTRICINISQ